MQTAKNISIKSYLADRGITPKSERGVQSIYLSPIRSERTPSFSVNTSKNVWYDFGIGEGGSIIDLVMRMENCTVREAFQRLENGNFSAPIRYTPPPPRENPNRVVIKDVKPLYRFGLMEYLDHRKIDIEVAMEHCREVLYTIRDKEYYAIGFANDRGGWELRNLYRKICSSPKAITTLLADTECGTLSDECVLFEGFMDFLSYKTIAKQQGDTTPRDAIVLNSVALMSDRVVQFLSNYKTLHSYLDNDEAGRATLDKLRPHLSREPIDHTQLYAPHKDLNEWWLYNRERKQKKSSTTHKQKNRQPLS